MNAKEIIRSITSISNSAQFDWRKVRDDITGVYAGASIDERVTLLKLYNAVMDLVDRHLSASSASDVDVFRSARKQDYNAMIASECLDGEGNVMPEALRMVTLREVEAGRMSADDELRRLAIGGPEAFRTPQPTRKGWGGFFRDRR